MSIVKGSNTMSRSSVVNNTRGDDLRYFRQQEGQQLKLKRHAARRAMARAALSIGATPQELRTVLEALGLDTTPTGLKIAIAVYKNAKAGGKTGWVPKEES